MLYFQRYTREQVHKMVLLAKILSPVLGVASEAIHAARERSSSRKEAISSTPESFSTDNVELEPGTN
jgi:hypothetical protein